MNVETQSKQSKQSKQLELRSGYYIAELRHPLHQARRIVVQVQGEQFVENGYFCTRSIIDGLDNCYILRGYIHLDVLGVEPMMNGFTVKDLTKHN